MRCLLQELKTPVQISFSSKISNDSENVDFSFQTIGQYYIKDGKYYLLFEEILEEQGKVKTTVRWSGEEAWIKRTGSVNMRLPFQLHQRLSGIYELPEIKMEVTSHTKELIHTWNDQSRTGSFHLIYTLRMQGESIGTYQIDIQFKEE